MSIEVVVNGDGYIKAVKSECNPTKIVVLDRGWVVVGKYLEKDEYVHVSNCSVIRDWGTENGLGELAELGKDKTPKKTILDKCPDIKAHKLSVVLIMDTNEKNWD